MKQLIFFFLTCLFLTSCGGAGIDPTDNITLGQAFGHVSQSFGYWVWIVITGLLLGVAVFLIIKKEIEVKLPMLGILVALFLVAIFMRPCEVAANTTVEQAARGVYIGY